MIIKELEMQIARELVQFKHGHSKLSDWIYEDMKRKNLTLNKDDFKDTYNSVVEKLKTQGLFV